jgi:hypothetical protein
MKPLYTASGNVKWQLLLLWKTVVWHFLNKVNRITDNSEVLLLGIHLKELKAQTQIDTGKPMFTVAVLQ